MARCYSLRGYRRLYQSFMHYLNLQKVEARWLIYQLNTANMDTCRMRHPNREYLEMDMIEFFNSVEKKSNPYFTVVQLYKSMEALLFNIHPDAITNEQHEAVKLAEYYLFELESRFLKEYGCEIDDLVTTYGECKWHLDPQPWAEPINVIMMH